ASFVDVDVSFWDDEEEGPLDDEQPTRAISPVTTESMRNNDISNLLVGTCRQRSCQARLRTHGQISVTRGADRWSKRSVVWRRLLDPSQPTLRALSSSRRARAVAPRRTARCGLGRGRRCPRAPRAYAGDESRDRRAFGRGRRHTEARR